MFQLLSARREADETRVVSIWKYDCSCFPFNSEVIVQFKHNRNDANTFNNENFNNSTIQQCSSISSRWTNHSIHHLNFTSVSEHTQSVIVSVVGQLKKLRLCFYYSPSTEYQFSRSRPIREKASQLVCLVNLSGQ